MKTALRFFWPVAAVFLVVSVSSIKAGTLGELFTAATASNQDYSVFTLDLELAQLKKTKGEIEAKVELDRVNASYTFTSALANYRRSVLSFYNEVIDAVFAAAAAELDLESVSLSLQNAKVDKDYADTRYRNGLISEEVFKEIDIAFKTTSNAQELSAWTLKDAKDTVLLVTGLAWNTSLLPELPAFEAVVRLEDWTARDTSLQLALLSEKIAALKTASMPTNASAYDKRIQETENLKTKALVANAESEAKRAYESAFSTLKNQANLLQIRKDEYALKEASYKDALLKYERGIISLGDKNIKEISVLNARKNLLAAQKSYIKSIGSYLSGTGANPLGL
ncbi:MAG: hypothetical protein CVV53_02890 [Spirochaetae bacterium HGW-Spirochaetae-9]|nr:MAG: hypothetical protein CVV53_02890 [Spirochaetae bacterium HGW-Spirochaetae-9]